MENTTIDASMCGLETPSRENWEANNDDIMKWVSIEFDVFSNNGEYGYGADNFPRFLRKRWAPKAVNSAMFCNGIGKRSISTCLNLIEDNGENHHDRQMALHVFE